MENTNKPFDWGEAFPTVTCPDGTKDIANGFAPPCMGKYGNKGSTLVICKDGTTKNQPSSPNAKYEDACRDNGGRAESQTVTQELQTKKQESILSKISGAYGKNLLIAGALVLGYLAYKKFKK
jgi:hypothetical protein